MKEFILKHPLLSLIGVVCVCNTVVDCMNMLVKNANFEKPIRITFGEGDTKGA